MIVVHLSDLQLFIIRTPEHIGKIQPVRSNYTYQNLFIPFSDPARRIISTTKGFKQSNSPLSNHLQISNVLEYPNARLVLTDFDWSVITAYSSALIGHGEFYFEE